MEDPAFREKNHRMFQILKRIHHKMEQKGNFLLKEEGLTMVQAHAILFLVHCENHCSSMKELEKDLCIAQSTVAGLVSRMEKGGFLEIYPDLEDKRVKNVKLTEKAEESGQRILERVMETDGRVLEAFTPVEQTMFVQLLEKLENSL